MIGLLRVLNATVSSSSLPSSLKLASNFLGVLPVGARRWVLRGHGQGCRYRWRTKRDGLEIRLTMLYAGSVWEELWKKALSV
jgi:hypothetical protein